MRDSGCSKPRPGLHSWNSQGTPGLGNHVILEFLPLAFSSSSGVSVHERGCHVQGPQTPGLEGEVHDRHPTSHAKS